MYIFLGENWFWKDIRCISR